MENLRNSYSIHGKNDESLIDVPRTLRENIVKEKRAMEEFSKEGVSSAFRALEASVGERRKLRVADTPARAHARPPFVMAAVRVAAIGRERGGHREFRA